MKRSLLLHYSIGYSGTTAAKRGRDIGIIVPFFIMLFGQFALLNAKHLCVSA